MFKKGIYLICPEPYEKNCEKNLNMENKLTLILESLMENWIDPLRFFKLHELWLCLDGSDSKASVYNVGDLGLIPGSGRSPGEENGNPLQYYCLENHMDGEAW